MGDLSPQCVELDHDTCRMPGCRCDCHEGGSHDRAKLPDSPPPDRLLVAL